MSNMKKGVSPLIASVLLIGFTIAMAALLTYWYTGNVRENIEKTGAVNAITLGCVNDVDFNVEEACVGVDSNGVSEIRITGKNNKDKILNGIKVRIIGNGNQFDIKSLNEYFNGQETKIAKVKYDTTKVTPIKIQVMPVIVREGYTGTCGDQVRELDVADC